MAEKMVVCEVSTGVARIILNRPPVNALNLEMIKDVVTAFEPCDGTNSAASAGRQRYLVSKLYVRSTPESGHVQRNSRFC